MSDTSPTVTSKVNKLSGVCFLYFYSVFFLIADASGEKEFDNSDQQHNVPPNSTLDMDLELVSFKPVIDVTGDSKVLKKILKEGEGAFTANEGAAVTGKYSYSWFDFCKGYGI